MYPIIQIGPIDISTHAIMNMIALVVFVIGVRRRVHQFMTSDSIHDEIDSIFYMSLGVMLGAWMGYTLPYFVRFLAGQFVPPNWWFMGTHWMGALAGGTLVGYIYCRRKGLPFGRISDSYAPMLPLAMAIGRIGCLMAGDAFGRVTDSWTAMRLPDALGVWAERYPTQIVSLIINLLIAGIILGFERYQVHGLKKPHGWPFDGFLFLLYIELFCAQRFYFEFWRGDFPSIYGPFTWAHLYCVIGVSLATWGIWRRLANKNLKERYFKTNDG